MYAGINECSYRRRHCGNEQESAADSSLINNAKQRAASSVPSSNQPELHQTRRGGFWRGTGGTARWDEREGWCSHLHQLYHLYLLFFPTHFVSNFPSGLTFTLFITSICRFTLFILYCPLFICICTLILSLGDLVSG